MNDFYVKPHRWLKQVFRLVWGALVNTAAILAGCYPHHIDHRKED